MFLFGFFIFFFLENPRGPMKCKWHVQNFSASGNQKKAENVMFCIAFNVIVLGIGNTKEVHVSKKVSCRKRNEKKVKEN